MKKLTDSYELFGGVKIPCVGFGTWQTPDGEVAVASVKEALAAGYRHVDTAAVYKNEGSVGRAIAESGIDRSEIFVTSKVWNSCRGYESTLSAFDETLNRLSLDYLDLYLIHWPANAHQFVNWDEINLETWRAMTKLYKEGKIRAIGVSNFKPHHLASLMKTEVKPMVNQIEFHPGFMQNETVSYCKKNGILVEAWSHLGTGKVLSNELLISLAQKYGVSPAQLCIRWCLQKGTLPLPKSVTPSRIVENTHVFDFEISAEDVEKIDALPFCGGSGHDSDLVNF